MKNIKGKLLNLGLAAVFAGAFFTSCHPRRDPAPKESVPAPDSYVGALDDSPAADTAYNAKMLKDARDHYPQLMAKYQTPYTDEIRDMERDMRRRIRGHDVFLLNPDIDIALALGVPAEQAAQREIDRTGVTLDSAQVMMLSLYFNGLASTIIATDFSLIASPATIHTWEGPDFIVPQTKYLDVIPFYVPIADKVRISTYHEFGHAMDNRYRGMPRLKLAGNMTVPNIQEYLHVGNFVRMQHNPMALEMISRGMKGEAFGDLFAAGEQICRGREPAAVLRDIRQWRNDNYSDTLHQSSVVVAGFEKNLDRIGADAFRQMTDSARMDLYYQTTEEYGLSRHDLKRAADLQKTVMSAEKHPHGTAAQWLALLEKQPEKYRTTLKILHFLATLDKSNFNDKSPYYTDLVTPPLEWNAVSDLTELAKKKSATLPPVESVIAAYRELQAGFEQRLDNNVNDIDARQRLLRLRKTFIDSLRTMDFSSFPDAKKTAAIRTAAFKR